MNHKRNKGAARSSGAVAASFSAFIVATLVLTVAVPVSAAPRRRITAKAGSKVKNPTIVPPATRVEKKISSRDVIKWSWTLRADRKAPPTQGLNQSKFFVIPPSPAKAIGPNGQALAGGSTIVGGLFSVATGTGTGTSVFPGTRTIPAGTVTWTVGVSGAPGGPPKDRPFWSAKMSGWDPWFIGFDELNDAGLLGENTVDLFFPVSMFGAETGFEGGEVGWEAWFDLSGTRYDLLNVLASEAGGVSVTDPASPANFSIDVYSMTDIFSTETDAGSILITPSSIQSALASDFTDGFMDNQIVLGFLLSGVPVADILAGETSLNFSATAAAGDAIPEPATFSLLALGGLMLAIHRRGVARLL